MNTLKNLQNWYEKYCDGYWEKEYGINISNLGNPGWTVDIDLAGTGLEEKFFETFQVERTKNNWISCRVEEMKFRGFGGSGNLEELLRIFLDWAQSTSDRS